MQPPFDINRLSSTTLRRLIGEHLGLPPALAEVLTDIVKHPIRLPGTPPAASRPSSDMLARWQSLLPGGQYRAVTALLADGARTYDAAARAAGISPNTLKIHLRRIRHDRPAVWQEIAQERQRQKAERHSAAIERDRQHSAAWFKYRDRRSRH